MQRRQLRQDIVRELTQATAGRQEVLEHVWWLAASGHVLADRLMALHADGVFDDFQQEVGDVEHWNTAYVDAQGPTGWLPLWGRSFLFDGNDDLGSVLGPLLSISFRDLWALWDSSRVPENATCRLVVLQDLWGVWELAGNPTAGQETKRLLDGVGDHLRLANASLTDEQRIVWEVKRRQFWRAVKQPDVVQRHIKSLEVWAQVNGPKTINRHAGG